MRLALLFLCLSSSAFGQRLFDPNLVLAIPSSGSNLGLVSQWKMDENTGTTTADNAGGKTATLAGTPNPSWTTGPNINAALSTSGSARMDAGTTSDWSFMENSGIWTFNCWFKTTDFTVAGQHVIWCTESGASKGVFIGLNRPSSTTRLMCQVRNAGGLVASFNDSSVGDNNWHMLTFLSNGSQVKAYLDGIASGTPVSLTGTGTGDSAAAAKFFDDGSADYFTGSCDDLRIYNTALSSGDITTLFNAGAQ